MSKRTVIARKILALVRSIMAIDEEGDGSGFQYLHDYKTNEDDQVEIGAKAGKKYILASKEPNGFWRIRACRDFGTIKKGSYGGCVESDENLSHDGKCWIFRGATVFDKAKVTDDAEVGGHTYIGEYALIKGTADISGNDIRIWDHAVVDSAVVRDEARIYGNAKVGIGSHICGESKIYENATVIGSYVEDANVYGSAEISGKSSITSKGRTKTEIFGTAKIVGKKITDGSISK